jgi:hypothetical protein
MLRPAALDLSDPAQLAEVHRNLQTLAAWHTAVRVVGLDPDDLLGALVLRLIERQRTRSRYDPARSALSTYVRVFGRGAVLNAIRDELRRRDRVARFRRSLFLVEELDGDVDVELVVGGE